MRIAQFSRFVSRLDGGIFFALTGLLPRLASTGSAELRVFGAADSHTAEDLRQLSPVPVEAFPAWPPHAFGFSPRLLPAARRFDPHAIHVHGLWANPALASLRLHRQRGTPLIVSPHGMLDAGALAISPFKKRLVARWFQLAQLRAAAVLHALTLAEARSIRAFDVDRPIVVIPNGVDLPPSPLPVATGNVDARSRPRTLLFLGRIHPKKGLDALLEAWIPFARDSEAGRTWRLVVAGWDEIGWEKQLRSQFAAAAAETVEFSGPLWAEKKHAAYQAADAFILPSRSEGLPMTVLEAWSHGKPALVTSACNLPEGIAAGAAIEIAPTVTAISRGLVTLAAMSDDDRQRMGRAGRQLVERRFTWARVAADFTRVYHAVSSRARLPPDLMFTES